YHSSVGCDRRGDQPTGYATPSACFHTPEITITHQVALVDLCSVSLMAGISLASADTGPERDLGMEEESRGLVLDFYDRFFNKHEINEAA
ncbi:MAG: hypothetical protein WC953_06660, partial [Pseudomonas sp.]